MKQTNDYNIKSSTKEYYFLKFFDIEIKFTSYLFGEYFYKTRSLGDRAYNIQIIALQKTDLRQVTMYIMLRIVDLISYKLQIMQRWWGTKYQVAKKYDLLENKYRIHNLSERQYYKRRYIRVKNSNIHILTMQKSDFRQVYTYIMLRISDFVPQQH